MARFISTSRSCFISEKVDEIKLHVKQHIIFYALNRTNSLLKYEQAYQRICRLVRWECSDVRLACATISAISTVGTRFRVRFINNSWWPTLRVENVEKIVGNKLY